MVEQLAELVDCKAPRVEPGGVCPFRQGSRMSETLLPARRCQGITRAGEPCRTNIVGDDGWCVVHRPSSTYDPTVTGRAGGIASGEVRRALANTARERLRRLADEDQEFWERLKAAYKDGLDAVDPDGKPDFRARVMTAGAFLAEAYGKPAQALIGDGEKPLRFVLESAFTRGSDEPAD
jgi:hypothetical protein